MRILQINSVCGYGSTGRTCTELAQFLKNKGHECFIAFGQGTTSYKESFKIGTRIENHLHNIGSRLLGKQGYFTRNGTAKLIQFIQRIKPDVIHLRNLHGNYLNLEMLFEYLSKADIPIVWTLHDCWAFTGKCSHYTDAGCFKWQTHCHHCPQIKKYPPSLFLDCSEQMFTDKKKWFTSIKNMTIVPVSQWVANEVKNSFLSKYPIVHIYNWIDGQIFKPYDQNIREKYGITSDVFLILGVAAGWNLNNSKIHDFVKLSRILPNSMQLVLVGGNDRPNILPDTVIHIPRVYDTREMAQLYSMADVYVHLSTEDTCPKVIIETLACGTPAIVYNSTGCPELVGEECGVIVEKRNIDQVYKALCKIQVAGKHSYSSQCIAFASDNFNYEANANKFINLYQQVCSS